jgi:hypothetical protein
VYRLDSGRTFPCDQVLNHRVGEFGAIEPGESLEGILLAYTMYDRVDYLHGEVAPASIFVIDQFGRKHRSEIEILIDRTATLPPFIRRPRGLYDDGEIKPVVCPEFRPVPCDPAEQKEAIGKEK